MLLALASCKKTDGLTGTTANVSISEAADMLSASLSSNSSGISSISYDASYRSQGIFDSKLACGSVVKDTINRHNETGAPTTFNYRLAYAYTLNCNANNLPDNITGAVNYSGSYSGPHISSTNTGDWSFKVAGLSPTATSYVLNGTYARTGTFASKADTTNHGSSNVSVVLTNLKLTKPGRVIAGGTATFTITGSVPKKGAFSYTGTLLFNGDGTAKLSVNGTYFTVNLATGEKTKV